MTLRHQKCPKCSGGIFPSFSRSGRGGWFKPPIIGSLNQPPRPLPQRRLRDIFLRSRPPLLSQGGEYLLLYIVLRGSSNVDARRLLLSGLLFTARANKDTREAVVALVAGGVK